MPKLVLDLNDGRPAWALPPWVAREIREALPDHWTLRIMDTEADGSGDGMVNLSTELLDAVEDAEIYLGYGVPPALLQAGPGLKWVHTGAAGVRGSLTPEMLESPVLFTNSKGIHGPPMGDTALAMILHFARGLDLAVAGQAQGEWNNEPFYRADHPLVELRRSAVGIFGFGGVGREVAWRVMALGARVLAFDRGPEAFQGSEEGGEVWTEPRSVGRWPGDDAPWAEGWEALHGEEGFHRLLAESDFLVLTAPETAGTRGAFDAGALARMKESATLINVSRGRLVDEEALVAALAGGRLRGAGLDVFASEPLPRGHPLWTLPNVLITPHVSAVTRHFWRRQTDLILENLDRYLSGRPLLNLVDKEAGF
jgi:phosphoglycerate dehydrogenase-like enzyme